MITMHPAVILGYHLNDWVPERLPLAQFEARLSALRQQMRANGWDGLIVHGDAQQGGLLAWLTNFCPRLRWALCLIGLEGEPQLLVAASTRDLPATRKLTWCQSVDVYGHAAKLLPEWGDSLRSVGVSSGPARIAVHDMSRMRNAVCKTIEKTLGGNAELRDAQSLLDTFIQPKQAYELGVVRQAHTLLRNVVRELQQAWREGRPVCEAVLQAELFARRAQAHDVRILFSVDGGRTLRPFEGIDTIKSPTLVCYIAVRHLGYWADTFVTCDAQDAAMARAAAAILEAFVKTAAPGITGTTLFKAVLPHLSDFEWHPMLEGQCGHGIGLALDERPNLSLDSDDAMQTGGLYSLQAGLANAKGQGVLISATVHLSAHGTERLNAED
jgi:Xaa-Pro aminopeptidase